jgi:nitrogenase molybdenum-iron protein beta chain
VSDLVDQPRFVCALGAIKSVQAIERAVPILHSGPGCGAKLAGGISEQNGGSPSGYISPQIYPCSNIGEREVVFGGAERLRQTIENALKVIDGDIFVALTGCTSALVGDDAEEVVRSFKGSDKPVILADTPGFIGNNIRGHEIVLDALIDQYMKPAKVEAGLVNIWATVPYQDAFWHGNLRALERLVSSLGLKPNTIFGPRRGVAALDRVSAASLNILASPWAGLAAVRKLEDKFGTPYIQYPTIPIGPYETGEFLRAVGSAAGVPSSRVEEAIRAGEEEYYYYIERSADIFLETRAMARRFTVIADSDYTLAISRFLVNDMGLFPSKLYITDDAPIEHRERIAGYFGGFLHGIKAEVEFSADGGAIHEEIVNTEFYGRPLILGSYWEKSLSKELRGHYVGVAMPVVDRLVLDRSYVGYEGALRLLEDIYGVVLETFI